MDFAFTPEQKAFREELRAFCNAEVAAKGRHAALSQESHDAEFYAALARRGYIGMQWPTAFGGQARSHMDMSVFYEEMQYAGAPLGRYTGSVVFVGESLIAYGSETQQRSYLPRIARGELLCSLCLSEPDAGSDAASLKTRITDLPGGRFRLTGQKIFTSGAHISDIALVAARTNPDAPRHLGISLFLVSLRDPAVTVRPLWTIAGWRVNQVFFEGVELESDALVGKRDAGWAQLRQTLAFERSAAGNVGLLMRLFDQILNHADAQGATPAQYERLVDLRARIEALRFMVYQLAWMQDRGLPADGVAATMKLQAGEDVVALTDLGMEIYGGRGPLRGSDAPGRGDAEFLYRSIPFFLNGGGTPDMQRIVVASRSLGLPRR